MKKRKIALIAKGGTYWLGGSYYIKNLIHCICALPAEERAQIELYLFVNAYEASIYDEVRDKIDYLILNEQQLAPYSLTNRVRWKLKRVLGKSFNPRLEEFLLKHQIDFIYPTLPRSGSNGKYQHAEWIPDFQYLHFPEGSSAVEIEERKKEFANIATHSPMVILSSEMAERDCHRHFPVSKPKTTVLRFKVFMTEEHLAGSIEAVREKYHLHERFFLISNLIAPTKNHLIALTALSILKQQGLSPILVFTGSCFDYRNPHFFNTILDFIHQHDLHQQVKILGIVPKQDQVTLMRHSIAVLQPSRFEGWHTGVEESKFLGKRILLSDIPVHQEQAPEYGVYFKDNNADELAAKMKDLVFLDQPDWDKLHEQRSIQQYKTHIQDYARFFIQLALK